MVDYHNDAEICKFVDQLRTSKEELEVLFEEHDGGSMTDYSQFICLAEDITEYADKLSERADKLFDEEQTEEDTDDA